MQSRTKAADAEEAAESTLHVVLIGIPTDRVRIVGPFRTAYEAAEWASDEANVRTRDDWWVVQLRSPREENK